MLNCVDSCERVYGTDRLVADVVVVVDEDDDADGGDDDDDEDDGVVDEEDDADDRDEFLVSLLSFLVSF